jgi:hypothetical protein
MQESMNAPIVQSNTTSAYSIHIQTERLFGKLFPKWQTNLMAFQLH